MNSQFCFKLKLLTTYFLSLSFIRLMSTAKIITNSFLNTFTSILSLSWKSLNSHLPLNEASSLHAKPFGRFKRSKTKKKKVDEKSKFSYINKKIINLTFISFFIGLIIGYTQTEVHRATTVVYLDTEANSSTNRQPWRTPKNFYLLLFILIIIYVITGYVVVRLGRRKTWLAKFQRLI